MALEKPYADIPGTTIFDADQVRNGYHLNMFCMSLMKQPNRERFKADERAYLDGWPLSEPQKRACPGARLQRHDRARRKHIFYRQNIRDRRQELSVRRRADDGHESRGLRSDDVERRAFAGLAG